MLSGYQYIQSINLRYGRTDVARCIETAQQLDNRYVTFCINTNLLNEGVKSCLLCV